MNLETFRTHFADLAAPMAVASPSGKLLEANDAFCKYLGYDHDELLRIPVFDFTHPDDRDRAKSLFQQVASGEIKQFHYEKRYLRKDGQEVWATVTTSWHHPHDSQTPLCIAVIQDITPRVIAERSCHKSEQLMEILLNNIDLGIALVDEDHTIVTINRTQAEMFHKNPSDFIGKHCFREFEKRSHICLHCPGVLAIKEGKPHIVETEGVRDDGSHFLVRIRALPVVEQDGQARKFIEVVEDITKTRAIEEELQRSHDQLNYMAHHDQVTGLPNKTLLYDRIHHAIDRARRAKEGIVVILFHLDRLNYINKSLGFEIGNKALKSVGERLKTYLRQSDSLSHMGGAEFGMVLEAGEIFQPSVKVAKRILSCLDETLFVVDGHELHITASVGISFYPEDGQDAETLLSAAESARIKAKEKGGNTHEYYQAEMGAEARRFLEMESQLHVALREDQLQAHYQPQIDPISGQIIGMEALVRWQHPEKGLVSPAEFIPLAEESGHILALGERMLEIACVQAEKWLPMLPLNFRVAVNVSALQFSRSDLGKSIKEMLMKTGLPPSHFEIELTESALMHDPENTLKVLKAIKRMGVRVALDDFGTGYSAMSYLKSFPIDRIKIDRSFVASLPHASHELAIVETVFNLGRKMRIDVIAEGVETSEQLNCLLDMGCTAIQGYYFSKPLDAESATENLKQWLGPYHVCPFRV